MNVFHLVFFEGCVFVSQMGQDCQPLFTVWDRLVLVELKAPSCTRDSNTNLQYRAPTNFYEENTKQDHKRFAPIPYEQLLAE
jgi:hypothetical protein